MKEVDLVLDDPKTVECVKQLEQVINILKLFASSKIFKTFRCCEKFKTCFSFYSGNQSSSAIEAPKYSRILWQ